jgi:flagellar hook protein FlgE
MALIRSLTAGTSSLKAHQQRLDVISNNIANINTIGYKSSRVTFADQFNQTFGSGSSPNAISAGGIGGIDPIQIGLGVKVGSIKLDFSQGAIQNTNRPLDMALQGDGFFVFRRNGQELYSRAGAFSLDSEGNLVDSSSGAFVQGYNLETDSNGRVLKDPNGTNRLARGVENIRISPSFKSAPRQTQNINVTGNLNASSATGSTYNTSINIFDSQGAPRVLGFTFTKSATPNQWDVSATIDGNAVTLPSSSITFNADGTLAAASITQNITAANLNAALGAGSTAFDATTPKNLKVSLADSSNLLGGLTQFSGQNTITAGGQDGYAAGELNRLSVDQTGKIIGSFTNGQSELLSQVVLAKFTNSDGLSKEGGNFFTVSPNSGLATLGTAVEIFPSTRVSAGSLEESNVDLTEQFTDLISTQRAFEAASRTVTISDQFLQEINGLKR